MKQQYLTSNIEFPIPYMHDGIMFGCGGIGLWLWGSGRDLHLTVGLGDLWDHRGGLHWTEKQNFKAIRAALEKKDADALSAIFPPKEGEPARPTLLPFGRISMRLPAGWKLRQCSLDLQTGIPEVLAVCGTRTAVIRFAASLAHGRNFGCTGLPAGTDVTLIPSWHLTRKMAERGIAAPAEYADTEQLYFCQPLPADPAAVLKICKKRSGFSAVCLRGMEDGNAILAVPTPSFARLRTASVQWWRNYWRDVPELQMPEENLMKLYYGGLFRYGILTDPDGVAPGLQGAWIEDDGLPPWEGDYHFNINVQMCISPGFCAGKYHHLKPMFDLVLSWKDQLRRNAQYFAGVEGYMLPHAVDDRCTCMGNFWSGAVDHGCTAWMAHLMYRYCQYCNDKDFLRDEVEDFMLGTLRVFRAMMNREPDGTLSLPISVSPEYKGCALDAWGKNSSFQLAAIHALARDLQETGEWLGHDADPLVQELQEHLPEITLLNNADGQEIALWEGQALDPGHRHHSHLAGIGVFGTVDPEEERYREIVQNSDSRWTMSGTGSWVGWSFPWAAQIKTRMGNPAAAQLMLHLWQDGFTSRTGISFIGAMYQGVTMGGRWWFGKNEDGSPRRLMQMDGEMACINAVSDLFAYCDRDVMYFFRGIRSDRQDASFRNVPLPFGVTASGAMRGGRAKVHLTASRDVQLKISLPGSPVREISLKAGEKYTF